MGERKTKFVVIYEGYTQNTAGLARVWAILHDLLANDDTVILLLPWTSDPSRIAGE